MLRAARTAVLILALMCCALAPISAQAGKEGIYVSESVYFTLEKVRLSEGSDDSILRFAVKLHNGSASSVDYNQYGVRVTDGDGYSYSAQLSGTQSARVLSGKEQEFAYESRVPKDSQAERLRVTVFAWSYGSGIAMTDLGSFSVANALQTSDAAHEAIVPLAPMDGTLSADSRVSFRIGNEYAVYENGEWNVYVDLIAGNLGDTGVTLPAGLKMRLENAGGQTMAVTAIDGADKSLLPGKPQRVTVQAPIPDSESAEGWALQFYYMNGEKATVLDSLDLGTSVASPVTAVGDSRPTTDSRGQEIVSLKVESAIVSQSGDGQWVRVGVTASNNGSRVVAVPSLSAAYQSTNGGVTVAAADSDTHAAYLSQGETEAFSFSALLPKGISVEELQLALFETRNAGGGTNDATTGGSGASTGTGTGASGVSSGSGSTGAASVASSSGTKVPVLIAGLGKAEVYDQGTGTDYTLGDRIELPLDKKLDVAVTELKLYDNENYGFKTAVAKLKITNLDNTAYALPELNLDVVGENGMVYTGTRQANVIAQLATNSSYMVSYSFVMPEATDGQAVALRMYNGSDSIPLHSVRLSIGQDDTADDVWDVYPYGITVNSADLLVGQLGTTFSYTLNFNAGLERKEQLIADASVSKLQFEIEDSSGLVLSTQTLPFQGTTKLLDGDNSIAFTNLKLNQYNSTNYVNVYEIVDTPNGIVKRKVGEIR
jgi:hypothetical protein